MKVPRLPLLTCALLLWTVEAPGQPAAPPSATPAPVSTMATWKPFQEFAFLLGSWAGTVDSGGRLGGRVSRFAIEVGGSYLVHRGSAVFPADAGKAEESIEHVGYVSYDRDKRRYTAWYGFSTGVSGTYDVEVLPDGAIRLLSRELQNFDSGARARMSMRKTPEGDLDLSMDIAPNGKDFVPYLASKLTKK